MSKANGGGKKLGGNQPARSKPGSYPVVTGEEKTEFDLRKTSKPPTPSEAPVDRPSEGRTSQLVIAPLEGSDGPMTIEEKAPPESFKQSETSPTLIFPEHSSESSIAIEGVSGNPAENASQHELSQFSEAAPSGEQTMEGAFAEPSTHATKPALSSISQDSGTVDPLIQDAATTARGTKSDLDVAPPNETGQRMAPAPDVRSTGSAEGKIHKPSKGWAALPEAHGVTAANAIGGTVEKPAAEIPIGSRELTTFSSKALPPSKSKLRPSIEHVTPLPSSTVGQDRRSEIDQSVRTVEFDHAQNNNAKAGVVRTGKQKGQRQRAVQRVNPNEGRVVKIVYGPSQVGRELAGYEVSPQFYGYIVDLRRLTEVELKTSQLAELLAKAKSIGARRLDADAARVHRSGFTADVRSGLIEEWIRQTRQDWPSYEKDVFNERGELVRRKGQLYDAHHIWPQIYEGPHDWSNLVPLHVDLHQKVIHLATTFKAIFP